MSLAADIRMREVVQEFPQPTELDIEQEIRKQLADLKVKSGASIAIGVGSRGITNYAQIVQVVFARFLEGGAKPFLIPAMGSHGGATEAGQRQLVEDHGLAELPIRAAMDSSVIGRSPSGYDLWCSREVQQADHIFVINRVKPHTDFIGELGSGCLKMLTIGISKREGAVTFHQHAVRDGYEKVLREIGAAQLENLPILGGVAIVEDQHHQTARLELLRPANWIEREEQLFQQARDLMPRIPFEDIDLLIVDRIGKNISGTGMDTNVIGREIHSYSTLAAREQTLPPYIKRIYIRGLTEETHGNAVGIGLADFIHQSIVPQIDHAATRMNALTALSLHSAKIPIACASDEEAIELALTSVGVTRAEDARVVQIRDTLNLRELQASEAMVSSEADLSSPRHCP
ncbi:MAG: lactate racemase domain-containing protein [Limisphaerales bacterium]